MKSFLVKIVLLSLILCIIPVLFYISNHPFIAAKKVSNSYSFNEKINWAPEPVDIDVLTIGSSISLNNISSEDVINCIDGKDYLNLSAWGLSMKNLNDLIPLYNNLYNPEIIITVSNFQDFYFSNVNFDVNELSNQLVNKEKTSIIDLSTDKYYFERTLDNRENYINSSIYTSLKYDEYGGVPLQYENFKINKKRYNGKFQFDNIDENEYENLKLLSRYIKNTKMKWFFVHSPVRENNHTEEYKEEVLSHLEKVKSILINDGHKVIDLSLLNMADDNFVDYAHLNSKGARLVAKLVCKELND